MTPSAAYRQLKAILTENSLPDLRFHDLRHTFATHALANGVDAKTLSGILGHTKASFTVDTYTHTTETETYDPVKDDSSSSSSGSSTDSDGFGGSSGGKF